MPTFLSWLWLLAAFVPLVFLERWVHRHLQGIWLLLFRSPEVATILYAITMLPGVLVHEASHWVMATVVGARTGRFSLLPERLPDGTLRLGFVETEQTDVFREALIGAAPLLVGSGIVLAISYGALGVGPAAGALAAADVAGVARNLLAVTEAPDAWMWLYLLFAISNSMMPSASDRRAWLPVLAGAGLLASFLIIAGLGALVRDAVAGPLEAGIQALAGAFTITVALDLAAVPALWLLELGLVRVTGLRVDY
ncbi:MAG: hypothetical protein KA764_11465 [Anaerolineales bacterium]|nr:hypothetical protein [Anaerolineales bacterium]